MRSSEKYSVMWVRTRFSPTLFLIQGLVAERLNLLQRKSNFALLSNALQVLLQSCFFHARQGYTIPSNEFSVCTGGSSWKIIKEDLDQLSGWDRELQHSAKLKIIDYFGHLNLKQTRPFKWNVIFRRGAVLLSFLLVVDFQSSCKECHSHHLLIERVNKLNQPMRGMLSYKLLGSLDGLQNSRGQFVRSQFGVSGHHLSH